MRGQQFMGSNYLQASIVLFYCCKLSFIMTCNEMCVCDSKMKKIMPTDHSNTNNVITNPIHSAKTHFKKIFTTWLRCFAMDAVSLLISRRKRYGFKMPQV